MFRAHSLELDTSQTHEWEEDAIVSYSKGTHSIRICSSGKLRKGFAREATVAPKDADRMGVRHDAAAKPESQKIAAANAKIVNPLRHRQAAQYVPVCVSRPTRMPRAMPALMASQAGWFQPTSCNMCYPLVRVRGPNWLDSSDGASEEQCVA